VPAGSGWNFIPDEVKISPSQWLAHFRKQLWAIARSGKAAGTLLKRNSFKMEPLPRTLFYGVLRPLLEQGRQLTMCYKRNCWRTRGLTETSLEALEGLCGFQNFNQVSGYQNARVATKKDCTFYHVIVKLEALHTHNLKTNVESAEFKVWVGALNPMANTNFHKDMERSTSNIQTLQRYLRAFPIRMHREGYVADESLRNVCKQLAQSARRSNSTDSGGPC
jgi:hypothetical protein